MPSEDRIVVKEVFPIGTYDFERVKPRSFSDPLFYIRHNHVADDPRFGFSAKPIHLETVQELRKIRTFDYVDWKEEMISENPLLTLGIQGCKVIILYDGKSMGMTHLLAGMHPEQSVSWMVENLVNHSNKIKGMIISGYKYCELPVDEYEVVDDLVSDGLSDDGIKQFLKENPVQESYDHRTLKQYCLSLGIRVVQGFHRNGNMDPQPRMDVIAFPSKRQVVIFSEKFHGNKRSLERIVRTFPGRS